MSARCAMRKCLPPRAVRQGSGAAGLPGGRFDSSTERPWDHVVQWQRARPMIPLSDENPTLHTPWMTWLLIGTTVAVWMVVQGAGTSVPLATSVCNLGLVPRSEER